MNKKTGMNIIIGGVSLAMVASMILPGLLGNGGGSQEQDTVIIKVNDTDITSKTLDQFRRADPLYNMAGEDFEGLIGDDLKTLMVRKLIDTQLVFHDAKDIKVSREEVNKDVKGIREKNNLQKNDQWTQALASNGFTDASFREEIRKQLATDKRRDQLFAKAPAITDKEAKFYYNINKKEYMGEPRVIGRKIVVKDKALAEKLLKEAQSDADFAQLATENSIENKDRGGALGAVKDGKISSVSLITLPDSVSTEVQKLTDGGLTNVIENGDKFYIVQVEEYIKAKAKPFDQVKKSIMSNLKKAREAKVYNEHINSLRKDAKIEYIDQKWKITDPVVGKVLDQEIPYSELLLQVYNSQQVANLLRQAPPEQAIGLINTSMKPGLTGQIIEGHAAPKIAKDLNLSIVGPGPLVVQTLKDYATRDVSINDEEVKAFYTENQETFKTTASAVIKEISFNDKAEAEAFRENYDGQTDLIEAAALAGGTVSERGQISSGGGQIDPKLDTAALEGDLREVGTTSLSTVVPLKERFALAAVSDFKPKEIKPFTEVSSTIREQLLTKKKAEVADEFIKEKTEALKPTNDLPKVLKAQKTRVEAADKARKQAEDAKKEQEKKDNQTDDKTTKNTESPKEQTESESSDTKKTEETSNSEESNAEPSDKTDNTTENTDTAQQTDTESSKEQSSEDNTETAEETEE